MNEEFFSVLQRMRRDDEDPSKKSSPDGEANKVKKESESGKIGESEVLHELTSLMRAVLINREKWKQRGKAVGLNYRDTRRKKQFYALAAATAIFTVKKKMKDRMSVNKIIKAIAPKTGVSEEGVYGN